MNCTIAIVDNPLSYETKQKRNGTYIVATSGSILTRSNLNPVLARCVQYNWSKDTNTDTLDLLNHLSHLSLALSPSQPSRLILRVS